MGVGLSDPGISAPRYTAGGRFRQRGQRRGEDDFHSRSKMAMRRVLCEENISEAPDREQMKGNAGRSSFLRRLRFTSKTRRSRFWVSGKAGGRRGGARIYHASAGGYGLAKCTALPPMVWSIPPITGVINKNKPGQVKSTVSLLEMGTPTPSREDPHLAGILRRS